MGLALLDGNLKALQIDIPQRPLADNGVGQHPVGLLIVAAEVLDRSASARMLLHSLGQSSCHPAADKRILRVILKITATERTAVDI